MSHITFSNCLHCVSVLHVYYSISVHVSLLFYLYSGLDPALVGLSMFYAMTISGLVQFTIRTSALVENLVRINVVTVDMCI